MAAPTPPRISTSLTDTTLADLVTMDRETLGHNLRPLFRDGLITLSPSREDRRVKMVALSEEGRGRLDQARPLWNVAQGTFEHAIGIESAAEIRRMMDLVAAQVLRAPVARGATGEN